MKYLHPKCKKCGRRGLLDKDLCAICYPDVFGEWSSKFMGERDKEGNPIQSPMKFKGGIRNKAK